MKYRETFTLKTDTYITYPYKVAQRATHNIAVLGPCRFDRSEPVARGVPQALPALPTRHVLRVPSGRLPGGETS